MTVVLIVCGEKGKVLPGSPALHHFVMCACGAEEFRKKKMLLLRKKISACTYCAELPVSS